MTQREFIINALDPEVLGPNKPVTDQFTVYAKDESEAGKIALRMARERASGNFRMVNIVGEK